MQNLGKDYWKVCQKPPYSPSEEDVEYFRHVLKTGTTLLLGCTHALIPISTHQMDIDPWYDGPNIIVGDWRDNTKFYDNMIGDGVFNFTKELADSVLEMASRHSRTLVVRSFRERMPRMLVADYFPEHSDFSIKPSFIMGKAHYNFFAWEFDNESSR